MKKHSLFSAAGFFHLYVIRYEFFKSRVKPEVLKAIEDAGYVEPTPIQQEAIPHVLMTRDAWLCSDGNR